MKKNNKIALRLTTSILFLGIFLIGIYAVKVNNNKITFGSNPKIKTKKKFKKISSEIINKNHYKGEIYNISTESLLADYPDNFDDLIKKGNMTIQGTVTNLKDNPVRKSPTLAFTIASIRVDKVLSGSNSTLNQIIKVMFPGGNMKKDILLKDMADKEYLNEEQKKDAQSSEIVTVKYSDSPLPQINQKLALILSKIPKGANGIVEECYSPVYAGKGVFIKNNNNEYLREEEPKPQGGGQNSPLTRSMSEDNDDAKMNQGMNSLIQSKYK